MKKSLRMCITFLLAFAMLFSSVQPLNLLAAEKNETHYLAFASDRHSDTKAISNSMKSFDSDTEYVNLIGDMVESTNSFKTSTVKKEVDDVFDNAETQIVYGSHDANANDDAGIMYGKTQGSSKLIYTGKNSDGTVAYYVYGVAYDDLDDASAAATAANAFKAWIDTIEDKTIPIFVAAHMPLHAQRKDNKGAYSWAKALNYAATGSESGTEIIRDVLFLHGHNHTSESNKEYYYAPGHSMVVQNGNSSTTVTTRFTYLTPGYLSSNKHATEVTITEDEITLVRTDGSLGTIERVGAEDSGLKVA